MRFTIDAAPPSDILLRRLRANDDHRWLHLVLDQIEQQRDLERERDRLSVAAPTPAPRKAGWQSEPGCPHFALIGAVLTLNMYPVGAEWVCTCGKPYVVAIQDGHKTLVAR